jgi:hypothetical protein
MNGKKSTLFASAVAATAVTVGVVSVASAASTHDSHHTLHLVASGGEHSAQHGGGPPALGAEDAFNEQLADQSGNLVGHAGGNCTIVSFKDGNGEALCSITLVLPGGDIVLGGLQPLSHDPFTMAVVGGTGNYDKASGAADVTVSPDRKRNVTVHLN